MGMIVRVSVIERDHDGFGWDVLLDAKVGEEILDGERGVSQSFKKTHLGAEFGGRDAERAEFAEIPLLADPVIAEDGDPGRIHESAAASS